jgi:hypothetical protein
MDFAVSSLVETLDKESVIRRAQKATVALVHVALLVNIEGRSKKELIPQFGLLDLLPHHHVVRCYQTNASKSGGLHLHSAR